MHVAECEVARIEESRLWAVNKGALTGAGLLRDGSADHQVVVAEQPVVHADVPLRAVEPARRCREEVSRLRLGAADIG